MPSTPLTKDSSEQPEESVTTAAAQDVSMVHNDSVIDPLAKELETPEEAQKRTLEIYNRTIKPRG